MLYVKTDILCFFFQRYERQYENWQEVKAIYRNEQTRQFQKKSSLQKQLICTRDNLRQIRQREREEETQQVSVKFESLCSGLWCQGCPSNAQNTW